MNKREALTTEIVNLVKSIRTANGFLTDVDPDNVTHWGDFIIPDKDAIIINIRDTLNQHSHSGQYKQTLTIEFDLGVVKGENTYRVVTNLIQDIQNVIYQNELMLKNKYGYISMLPAVDDINIERTERIRGEGFLSIDIDHSAEVKWKVDTTNYTIE